MLDQSNLSAQRCLLIFWVKCSVGGYLALAKTILTTLSKMFKSRHMKKCFRQKNQLFLLLLLPIIQCKQRYTSLPCNVTVEDLKYFFQFPKLLNSLLCMIRYW
jgi:hypothetical protein